MRDCSLFFAHFVLSSLTVRWSSRVLLEFCSSFPDVFWSRLCAECEEGTRKLAATGLCCVPQDLSWSLENLHIWRTTGAWKEVAKQVLMEPLLYALIIVSSSAKVHARDSSLATVAFHLQVSDHLILSPNPHQTLIKPHLSPNPLV